MIKINIEDLIHRALENQAMEMKKKEMQAFLQNQFPELSPEQIKELTRPIPPGRVIPPSRQKVVASIANQLENQVRGLKAKERKNFVLVKLPSLASKEQDDLVKELTRPIPPKRKPESGKRVGGVTIDITDKIKEAGAVRDGFVHPLDISPTGTRPIPPGRRSNPKSSRPIPPRRRGG